MARILVLDAYEPLRIMVKIVLEEQGGHEVATAACGAAGFEMAVSWKPDLALIEVELPKEGGYEACRRIAALGDEMRTPVLMISGHPDPGLRERAAQAGARHVLCKPFTADQLLAGVTALLADMHSERGIPGVAAC